MHVAFAENRMFKFITSTEIRETSPEHRPHPSTAAPQSSALPAQSATSSTDTTTHNLVLRLVSRSRSTTAVKGSTASVIMGNSCAPPPARSLELTLGCVPSGVLEALRDDTAAFGKLGHDLFVQPDIHLGRAVEAAFVPELLRKLLAGGET